MAKKRDEINDSVARAARTSDAAGPGKGRRDNPADWLGRGLRRLYQDTVSEPIPDKFRSLLDQLDQQDAGSGKPPKKSS